MSHLTQEEYNEPVLVTRYELTESEFMDSLERVPTGSFDRHYGKLKSPANQTPRDYFESRKQARTWYRKQKELGDPVRIKTAKDIADEMLADERIEKLQTEGLL